jgi:hypothetical protein
MARPNYTGVALAAALAAQNIFAPAASAKLSDRIDPNHAPADILGVVCPANGDYKGTSQLTREQDRERVVMCSQIWYGAYLCTGWQEQLNAMLNQASGAGIKIQTQDIDPVAFKIDGTFGPHIKANADYMKRYTDRERIDRVTKWNAAAGEIVTSIMNTNSYANADIIGFIRAPMFGMMCPHLKPGGGASPR